MPSALEATLRNYLKHHWTPNPAGWLFANRKGTHPRWRDNVVKYGLKPILRKLEIPEENAGLHCFRHGLATELAERSVPITVLQQQMRHADADVRTTLRVYAHAIPQSQRDAMEMLWNLSVQLEQVPVMEQNPSPNFLFSVGWRRRVGVENITDRNLKDLEGMLGNTKSLKRNNRKCKGILIVPSMAPRFLFRSPRFRRCISHPLSKSCGRL